MYGGTEVDRALCVMTAILYQQAASGETLVAVWRGYICAADR